MTVDEPLRFLPLPFRKVWGGRRLEGYLGERFPDHPVGEVWQLAERDGCSSVVAEGAYAGRSLSGLMLSERESLLGSSRPTADGHFPLLVKLIDAAVPLSVQVHPDARSAARLKSESKDECWYVLFAEPGSVVHLGLRPGVDAKSFAGAASSPDVLDLLETYDVRPGQFLAVPAGTVHAISGGVTLVEVQENADTTYRLFDWDRPGLDGRLRPLHVEQALQSIDFERRAEGPVAPAFETVGGVNEQARLWTADRFRVELLRANRAWERDARGRPVIYVVLAGRGTLRAGAHERAARLSRGQVWLVPASLGAHRIAECDGELEVLAIEALE